MQQSVGAPMKCTYSKDIAMFQNFIPRLRKERGCGRQIQDIVIMCYWLQI